MRQSPWWNRIKCPMGTSRGKDQQGDDGERSHRLDDGGWGQGGDDGGMSLSGARNPTNIVLCLSC